MSLFIEENAYVLDHEGKPRRDGKPYAQAACVAINPEDIAHVHQIYVEVPEVNQRPGSRLNVTMKNGTVYQLFVGYSEFIVRANNAIYERRVHR